MIVQAVAFVLVLGAVVAVLIGAAGLAADMMADQIELTCAITAVGLSAAHLLRTAYGEQPLAPGIGPTFLRLHPPTPPYTLAQGLPHVRAHAVEHLPSTCP